jgi:plastocyanin
MRVLRFVLGGGIGLATLLGVIVAPAYAQPVPHRFIFMNDVCDPTTFNAMFGPDTCVRTGPGVPLNTFVKELKLLHFVPGWLFAPQVVVASTTDPIQVKNIGGEVHTFTEVAKFGGGVVPLLNDLGGFGPTVPECAAPPNEDNHILTPGASFTFAEDKVGTHLYQCCIHPWMHETLTVRP